MAVFLTNSTAGRISPRDSAAQLKNGTLVIAVRMPGKFDSGHLASAINIPLDEIETALTKRVKHKSQVLLLPCASGMRSGMAQKKVNSMGYTNAFNLGSVGPAGRIVGDVR